jgi:hypothetical protein
MDYKLIKQFGTKDELKKYLVNLSKATYFNKEYFIKDYFSIEFI